MCGTELMKEEGSPMRSFSTRCNQNCRDTWNCSLMVIALWGLTDPSTSCGV